MYITIATECDNCGGSKYILVTDDYPSTKIVEEMRDKVPVVCGNLCIKRIESGFIFEIGDEDYIYES